MIMDHFPTEVKFGCTVFLFTVKVRFLSGKSSANFDIFLFVLLQMCQGCIAPVAGLALVGPVEGSHEVVPLGRVAPADVHLQHERRFRLIVALLVAIEKRTLCLVSDKIGLQLATGRIRG